MSFAETKTEPAIFGAAATAAADPALRMMRYDARKKSVGVGYLLLLLVGGLGVHRFYLRRPLSGFAILACTVLGFVTMGLAWVVSGLWMLIDLVLVPGMVRTHNEALIRELT